MANLLLTFLKGKGVMNETQKLWVLTNTGTQVFVGCSSGNPAWTNTKSCHHGRSYALVQSPWEVLKTLSLEVPAWQGPKQPDLTLKYESTLRGGWTRSPPQVLPGLSLSMLLCFLDSFLTSSLWGDFRESALYTRTKIPYQYFASWKN